MKTSKRLDQMADLKDFVMELELMLKIHGDLIRGEARFMRPFNEMQSAAKTKLEDLEKQWAKRAVS